MASRFINPDHTFVETPFGIISWDPQSNKPLVNGEAKRLWDEAVVGDPSIANPQAYTALPSATPRTPSAVAQADLKIVNDDIQGIETAIGFGFAMTLDTGVFWLFFDVPQPDTSYIPFAQAPGYNADVTDQNIDYIEVTVTNRANHAATPSRLLISVQRIT